MVVPLFEKLIESDGSVFAMQPAFHHIIDAHEHADVVGPVGLCPRIATVPHEGIFITEMIREYMDQIRDEAFGCAITWLKTPVDRGFGLGQQLEQDAMLRIDIVVANSKARIPGGDAHAATVTL